MLSLSHRALCCGLKITPVKSKITNREYRSEMYVPSMVKGIDHLRDPRINKGLAFTIPERQSLGIHGLLAASVTTQDQQIKLCKFFIDRYSNPLNKYVYLVELQDANERLFFSLLNTDIEKYMPLVYTPTVGLACQRFGLIYKRPRGIFITIKDKGHIYEVLSNWPERDIRAIVFTDGERILGLGDLGAYGMGIPVGKLALYTALAGVKPHQCLPITLDVGTNTKKLLEDPLYIGLREKRTEGKEYSEFIEEFMQACVRRFGPQTLLQFEDFAYQHATPLLHKYRNKYTTFNDDVQGTASVAVAGLFAAGRISKKKLGENIFFFFGAGSAATGIADLTVLAMIEDGMSENDARSCIFMYDREGLVSTKRPSGVPSLCKHYAKDLPPSKDLEKSIADIKPTILIGTSTVGNTFTPAILKQMAKNAERPIIFALSNPTIKAECTAQQAYDNTDGRCVYASGSPFPPVEYKGKTFYTGQGNNSYIFPGLALGVICSSCNTIPESMFLCASRTLANLVKESDLNVGRIYPPLREILSISVKIAEEIMKLSYDKKLATLYPKPKNFTEYIKNSMYRLEYADYMPSIYDYETPKEIKLKSIEEVYNSEVPRMPRVNK